MVGVNLAGVGDWAIGSSRAGLSLATRLTAVENFVGFEEIFARRRLQRSGGHRVAINPRFRRWTFRSGWRSAWVANGSIAVSVFSSLPGPSRTSKHAKTSSVSHVTTSRHQL